MGTERRSVLLIAFLLGAVVPETARARQEEPRPEVRTSATSERSVEPDRAVVTLRFSGLGVSPLGAGEVVAVLADSLRDALASLGIPRDSLVTSSQRYWWRGRIERVPGPARHVNIPRDPATGATTRVVQDTLFRAHDAIEVRIRDVRLVGAVIDTALAHGVTDLSNVTFQATDVTEAHESALREATERARRNAEIIAEASGGRLGRTLMLSTEPDPGRERSFNFGATALMDARPAAGTEVVQPQVMVRVTVTARWELLNGR